MTYYTYPGNRIGLHAIDQLFYPQEFKHYKDERKFRAKPSRIVFIFEPKFTIASGGITDRTIGDNNQRRKANEHLMKTILNWIGKHTKEIPEIANPERSTKQFVLNLQPAMFNVQRFIFPGQTASRQPTKPDPSETESQRPTFPR